MELIHYTNNGRQYLGIQWPINCDAVHSCVELSDGVDQQIPLTVIRAIEDGSISAGEVASVMRGVLNRSPTLAKALAHAVAEAHGFCNGRADTGAPTDWLLMATDAVSPEFLAAPSWRIVGGEAFRYDRWIDMPNTISLLTPPRMAANILLNANNAEDLQLASLECIYRDKPELACSIAEYINESWPYILGTGV